MKHLYVTFLLCGWLYTNLNAQVSENTIIVYSKSLSQRNARMIKCDTIAPYLEPIYAGFIRAVVHYKNGLRNHSSTQQLKADYKHAQKAINKLLDKRSRKLYKRLVKYTGNILLISTSDK